MKISIRICGNSYQNNDGIIKCVEKSAELFTSIGYEIAKNRVYKLIENKWQSPPSYRGYAINIDTEEKKVYFTVNCKSGFNENEYARFIEIPHITINALEYDLMFLRDSLSRNFNCSIFDPCRINIETPDKHLNANLDQIFKSAFRTHLSTYSGLKIRIQNNTYKEAIDSGAINNRDIVSSIIYHGGSRSWISTPVYAINKDIFKELFGFTSNQLLAECKNKYNTPKAPSGISVFINNSYIDSKEFCEMSDMDIRIYSMLINKLNREECLYLGNSFLMPTHDNKAHIIDIVGMSCLNNDGIIGNVSTITINGDNVEAQKYNIYIKDGIFKIK